MRATLAEQISNSEKGKTILFSVGQAGFIVKSKSGQLLGIDLYLSDCVERDENSIGFKRLLPHIIEPEDITLDVIIATHPHLDHYDYDAMPKLMNNGHTHLFASKECDKYVKDQNIDVNRVNFVAPGDLHVLGDFKIYFTDCDHGTGAPDAVGVLVEVDGVRIYEAGDTCLRLDYADRVKSLGKVDVLIAPINGAYGNLDEQDCAILSGNIKPELTIPCHYGMFASHGGNPGLFMKKMAELNSDGEYILLTMGEKLVLTKEEK